MRTILWIDDNQGELDAARRMLTAVPSLDLNLLTASRSDDAGKILFSSTQLVDVVVTDILRRYTDGSVSSDDGYSFFRSEIRPRYPTMSVIFHTKNLPGSFDVDRNSQYLSKWESESFKAIELERRLSAIDPIFDAFADHSAWAKIEPRLVGVSSHILSELKSFGEIWRLQPHQLEQLVAELLDRIGYDVLWIPGGRDGGVDVVASTTGLDFLIDVKQYSPERPVRVEMVRQIYGVAAHVGAERPGKLVQGGIITTSRFTSDAEAFRNSTRPRPLLRDSEWLRSELKRYAPRLRNPDNQGLEADS